MTGRRNGQRRRYHCPDCHALLALVRPEMLILRRLIITDAARSAERIDGEVRIVCLCGRVSLFTWPVLQS